MNEDDLERSISIALEAARKWDAKGDSNWAARTYVQAVMAGLRGAVKQPDVGVGIAFLEDHGIPDCLTRAVELSQELCGAVASGQLPASVIGGNYHLSVLAHVGWILDKGGLATQALVVANQEAIKRLSPVFWSEYALALQQLDREIPYSPPERRWKRQEYWAPYLRLVSDYTRGVATVESTALVVEHFQKRNRDRRFRDDQYGIEGAGEEPAAWDFRLASLQLCSAKVQRATASATPFGEEPL